MPPLEDWDELIAEDVLEFEAGSDAYYAWNNIIRSGRPLWPKRDWKDEYQIAAEEGRAPNLTREQIEAVERAEWIKRSRAQQELPAWRRAMIGAIQSADDLEDQISTLLWFASMLGAKTVGPAARGLEGAAVAGDLLDQFQNALALPGMGRAIKSPAERAARRARKAREGGRGRTKNLRDWFKENWGHLLEAGQASSTWTGVGIALGPIFGVIEDGYWSIARTTARGQLELADLLVPGSKQEFIDLEQQILNEIESAWRATWGNKARLSQYTVTADELGGFWEIDEPEEELPRLTQKQKAALKRAEKAAKRTLSREPTSFDDPTPIELQ